MLMKAKNIAASINEQLLLCGLKMQTIVEVFA